GRSGGEGVVQRVIAKGGESAFFSELEAGNVRFRMGLFDGAAGSWDAGVIKAKSMRLKLKAGADHPDQVAAMGDAFRRRWQGFEFTAVEVEQTDLVWGYSARTAGRIEGSRMEAIR